MTTRVGIRVRLLDLLLARLSGASGWGAFVSRLQRTAGLRCPFCGGRGEWVEADPKEPRRFLRAEETGDRYDTEEGPSLVANRRGDVWQCRGRCRGRTNSPRVDIGGSRPSVANPRPVRRCGYCGRKLDDDGRCPFCGPATCSNTDGGIRIHETTITGRNPTEDTLALLVDSQRREWERDAEVSSYRWVRPRPELGPKFGRVDPSRAAWVSASFVGSRMSERDDIALFNSSYPQSIGRYWPGYSLVPDSELALPLEPPKATQQRRRAATGIPREWTDDPQIDIKWAHLLKRTNP